MIPEVRLVVLRDMVPVLRRTAQVRQSALASIEADCVEWAIGELERHLDPQQTDERRDAPDNTGETA